MDLPTGTITFLFTDIEGSTKLWESQPDAMKAALARHDALLKQAIEARGGYIFKTVGDAFCAAFANAADALAATLAAQKAIHTDAWDSKIGAIRIRAALHTGAAEERDGDYFGPPLNRVARLLSAGHGGQTLITLATQELVRDNLPPKVVLLDMGDHRLKDLFRPEHIYQVNAHDLPAEFAPLKTLDLKLTNLPAQSTPFIGRERELAAVLALIRRSDVRLVTLTGAGGTGKTRLLLQVAADLLDEYEQGVYFVALAAITDPELVIPSIASTLGVKESGGQPVEVALQDYLKDKHLLLVLDNLEQVVKAAPKLGDLLAASARLEIITSSREKLRLRGEHEYSVPPLGLPNIKKKETVAVLSQYEAVALFIQRAKAASAHWEITEANAPAVAEICVKLDGLPLAIELAAARSKMLTPEAMLDKLSDRLKALIGGARDLPARQQTIRAAIDWSYNLLDEGEKTLFARLGVFVGGWTLEAAESVCNSVGADRERAASSRDAPLPLLPIEVADGLESLLDKSLIRYGDSASGETRFAMLETIREYAAERLDNSGATGSIRNAHASYYVILVERSEPELRGPDQAAWLRQLEEDHDNWRAALAWSLDSGAAAMALRLVGALERFWDARSYYIEGTRSCARALEKAADAPPNVWAKAFTTEAWLAYRMGEYDKAKEGNEKALAIYHELGDKPKMTFVLTTLASLSMFAGQYEAAAKSLEDALAISQEIGDNDRIAHVLNVMGELARVRGDIQQAVHSYEGAIALYRERGDMMRLGSSLHNLGHATRRLGNYQRARALHEESLAIFQELGTIDKLGYQLGGLAAVLAATGQPGRAARLFGAWEASREMIGAIIDPTDRLEYDHNVAAARAQMDAADFDKAWAGGKSMSLDEAVAYALKESEDD